LGFAVGDLAGSLAASAKAAGGLLVRVGEVVSEMVLALILAVMISLEPHLVQRIAPYLPGQGWERVLEDTWNRMGYWARAQFLIALSFALLMGGWLFLLGVPSPFALGLLGGLLEVIPFVGGITTALLASLLALSSKGTLTALLVLAGYGGIALLEGKLLIPLIYGRTLGFHPALVLLTIFAFGKLFGLLGVFLAVPMTILLSGLLRALARLSGHTVLLQHRKPSPRLRYALFGAPAVALATAGYLTHHVDQGPLLRLCPRPAQDLPGHGGHVPFPEKEEVQVEVHRALLGPLKVDVGPLPHPLLQIEKKGGQGVGRRGADHAKDLVVWVQNPPDLHRGAELRGVLHVDLHKKEGV
jgi:hypothetical protein